VNISQPNLRSEKFDDDDDNNNNNKSTTYLAFETLYFADYQKIV